MDGAEAEVPRNVNSNNDPPVVFPWMGRQGVHCTLIGVESLIDQGLRWIIAKLARMEDIARGALEATPPCIKILRFQAARINMLMAGYIFPNALL